MGEQRAEQTLAIGQPFVGQLDRLRLAYWVRDEPALVQPLHSLPVETFPGRAGGIAIEPQERQHSLIDFVPVDIQKGTGREVPVNRSCASYRSPCDNF